MPTPPSFRTTISGTDRSRLAATIPKAGIDVLLRLHDTAEVDTWLARLALCFVVAAIASFAALLGWLVLAHENPPPWLWGAGLGIGFAAAVLCHIYNAAHDSLPPD